MLAIIDGVRTPFCKAGGRLSGWDADDLGAFVTREVIARTGISPGDVDEVIFGNVAQPAHACNVARVIALKAGLPESTIAHTVQRNCASGMQAFATAAMQIQTGESDLIIVGGAESMTNIPLLFGDKMTELFANMFRAKTAGKRIKALASFRPGFLKPIIGLQLGLSDVYSGLNMGQTAEILAREFGITRSDQDEFALMSHQRAIAAQQAGRINEELSPIFDDRYKTTLNADDGPRDGQTLEALGKLRPYFDRHAGTVTVGNACPVTDGAAAMIVASPKRAKELGLEPIGYMTGYAFAALAGSHMGLGPAYATAKLFDRTGMKMSDFDIVELNEAFAAQVIANERAFESQEFAREHLGRKKALGAIGRERLNVNGGAIAFGHPVGATGARLILTALQELKRRGDSKALATLCIGGGQGAAFALEAA